MNDILPEFWNLLGIPQVWGIGLTLLVLSVGYFTRKQIDLLQARILQEHQIRFASYYLKRLELMEDTYNDLSSIYYFAMATQGRGRDNPEFPRRILETAMLAEQRFLPKKLFLSKPQAAEIHELISVATSIASRLLNPEYQIDESEMSGFKDRLHDAMNNLESDFKNEIFGSESELVRVDNEYVKKIGE